MEDPGILEHPPQLRPPGRKVNSFSELSLNWSRSTLTNSKLALCFSCELNWEC